MTPNVGRTDQFARSLAGPALIGAGYRLVGGRHRLAGAILIALGTALLESAITRVCPANALIGLDSRTPDEVARDEREVFGHAHGLRQVMVSRP